MDVKIATAKSRKNLFRYWLGKRRTGWLIIEETTLPVTKWRTLGKFPTATITKVSWAGDHLHLHLGDSSYVDVPLAGQPVLHTIKTVRVPQVKTLTR